MDRRNSIKALLVGSMATGVLVEACKPSEKKAIVASTDATLNMDRMQEEIEAAKKLSALPNFFNAHEMATITVLGDIIIPRDKVSGSASDAKVPEFIEFIVKDMPEHQVPMQGGLRWLDMQCFKHYDKTFVDCSKQQQIEMVDAIAYPEKAKPAVKQGVAFFNLMRDLVSTGFYTSEIGVKDIGYMGNVPNQWNGVPDDVLKQYGYAYSERELKECLSFDKA
jgi:hypothetical protein